MTTKSKSAISNNSVNQNDEQNEKLSIEGVLADLESSNKENDMKENEAAVFYRDVLQFRAAKESFLTANETNQLLLDFNRNYRALLLTAVSSEEKISISDAVCLLRDILIMCHQKGQSWSSLALELNSLFDKKVRKPFTINDLKTYLKAESSSYLSFAEPYDVDHEEKAARFNKNTSNLVSKRIDLTFKDDDDDDANEEQVQEPKQTKVVYSAVDQNGELVDWSSLIGERISVNGTDYQVSKIADKDQIMLISDNFEAVEPEKFNNQSIEIHIVTSL